MLVLGTACPMTGAELCRCGGHPEGEQGSINPLPCKLQWHPLSCSGRTHQGVPTGTARLVGTASARHLESAIAMKLQWGGGALQVAGPGLRAAELLHGEEQQSQ